ncbi:MAG TPA: Asp-tRNA(Asn)/Glu-tRNA(Gln) amidotransferase subunit GatB [Gemmatimonadota bacterium]|nr:Asp-tRNA(Asn)/Glu-tRNA(Gln) amidotransferase subunit GatB [Gemmatimonadota bacterium]
MSADGAWETVIGVEVHVQLRTATKMFCGCEAAYGAAPNTRVCPVCLGLPGALPVPNRRAVELAVRAALALGCSVREWSEFTRKNYFYPDLPKGYQITQFEHPLAFDGELPVRVDGEVRRVRIRRLHLEEDAGKSLHDRFPGSTAVDLNRAGVPLVEIVTEPDLRSPAEARAYLSRVKQTLEHFAAVSDCNMEEGSLRVDANLSVRRAGSRVLNTKTEVKNLNSFSNVEKALAFERERQVALLEDGGEVAHETRTFDAASGRTRSMRGKEEAFDYRYFPEPDLPLLELEEGTVERIRAALPELPHAAEERLREAYDLSLYDAGLLAATPRRLTFFEAVAGDGDAAFAKQAANFVMGPVAEALNRAGEGAAEEDLLPAADLRRAVELRLDGTLTSSAADQLLERLLEEGGGDVDGLVASMGLARVSDAGQLAGWVEEALAEHPGEAERLRAGEEKLLGFFMGAVMRRAGGAADPGRTRELLREELGSPEEG